MRKFMVKFLRKTESLCEKIARVYCQIYQFSLILYGVGVRYDVDIFKLTNWSHAYSRIVLCAGYSYTTYCSLCWSLVCYVLFIVLVTRLLRIVYCAC